MNTNDTGGAAFPVPDIDGGKVCEGMTLLDYFAAQALSGLLAGLDRDARRFMERQAEPAEAMAKACYTMAEAMLKERQA